MFPGNEDGWLTALHYHILSQVSGGSLSFKKTNQDTGAISCNLDTGRLILVRRRRFMTRDTEFAPAACLVTAGVADTRAVGTVTTQSVVGQRCQLRPPRNLNLKFPGHSSLNYCDLPVA